MTPASAVGEISPTFDKGLCLTGFMVAQEIFPLGSLDQIGCFQNRCPEKPQSPVSMVHRCKNSFPPLWTCFIWCLLSTDKSTRSTSQLSNNAAQINKVTSSVSKCSEAFLISYCRAAAFHCAFNAIELSRTGLAWLVKIHTPLHF